MKTNAAWDSLAFFLTRLRGLRCCPSADLGGGKGFCVSTRSEFASDNWAFFPSALPDAGPVEEAVRFFGKQGRPFVWPLFGGEEEAELLKRAGLGEGGRLLAMSWHVPNETEGEGASAAADGGPSFCPVRSHDGALRWARAAWLGFDGEGDPAHEFQDLADAMSGDPSLRLMTARLEGEDVGSCLLSLSDGEAGAYYFAVLPRYRRRGVASAMMREAGRMARSEGRERIVLQATPSGVPFYLSMGFERLFEIPLFSTTNEVF